VYIFTKENTDKANRLLGKLINATAIQLS